MRDFVLESDRPKPTYRPGSSALGTPPAAGRSQRFFRTAQRSQPVGALAGDEGLEPGSNQCGLFVYSAEAAGIGEQLVVDIECRSHML